jgi:hypothetical protein
MSSLEFAHVFGVVLPAELDRAVPVRLEVMPGPYGRHWFDEDEGAQIVTVTMPHQLIGAFDRLTSAGFLVLP